MIEQHLTELKQISQDVMSMDFSGAVPSTIQANLLELSSYKARVNDIKPEVQYLYDTKLGDVSTNPKKLQMTTYKEWRDYEMRNERRVLEYCDRINSTIERCSENFRSVLSSIKHELLQQ